MNSESKKFTTIDRKHLANLFELETKRFLDLHPKSGVLFEQAKTVMPGGVPMSWMIKWPGKYPIFVESANGARFSDVDGNDYVDFCLGDTGSMTGHSPKPTVDAITKQMQQGITLMLPTKDSLEVSAELTRRFGLPLWQYTVSATDANRNVIRYSRAITGRSKIIVIDQCYHGSVDESFGSLDEAGNIIQRIGNIGAPVPISETTRVVPFNDLDAMEKALANKDVAAVLMEPAMTNIGIVLPQPGYLIGVEELTKKYGTLLIIDETHTISAGVGGMTKRDGLKPDFFTIGKAIAGGIPTGAYGMTAEVAQRISEVAKRETIDTVGVGGTLAGNALSMAAMRATLSQVMTETAFKKMINLADAWSDGVDAAIAEFNLPWHCSRLGARGEYLFLDHAPITGREAMLAGDFDLEQYVHLRCLNDGFLITPFHNMALMCPSTTKEDVDAHTIAFRKMCADLVNA